MNIEKFSAYKNCQYSVLLDDSNFKTKYILTSRKLAQTFFGETIEEVENKAKIYIDQLYDEYDKKINTPLTEQEKGRLLKKLSNSYLKKDIKTVLLKGGYISSKNFEFSARELKAGFPLIRDSISDIYLTENVTLELINDYNSIYYFPIIVDCKISRFEYEKGRIADELNS